MYIIIIIILSSNRLVQPVGRIKHVKFIQPVEPTVASLKLSFNCYIWTIYANEVPNNPIESTYKHHASKDVIFSFALNIIFLNMASPTLVWSTDEI